MLLATLHLETAAHGEVYRAARLALLRQQILRHITRTDHSAEKVEQALAVLANTLAARHQGTNRSAMGF
jgi:hypothetical protein